MTVKNIERNGNQATIVVEIDKELMESGVQKAYLKARKNIQIPGFRKGKAPRVLIEKMYGAHVFYEDGLEEIFPEVYKTAVADQDLKAIGRPSLTDMDISEDGIVTLTLTTDTYPEVTLGEYKGLEVEKAEATVTDEQVKAELDRMAQNVASTETVDGSAKMGDTANIDFEGFDNGVPFDGGKGENFDLKLGSNSFVPGFEEQVVGMSAGEEKDIDITFPEDYHKELAGKAVVFHVKCNKVTTTILPELDDEFAKDVSEFDTLEALTADIRAKALENAQKQIDSAFEQAVVDKAAENTTVDMPAALIEAELDNQMERFAYQLQMSGYSVEQYAKMMGGDLNTMRSAFRPAAEKQAKVNVTLEKIIEVEGITVTDEDVEAEYAAVAAQYSLELDKVKSMVPVEEIQTSLKTRKAVKVIVDSAKAKKPAKAKKTTTKKTTTKKTAKTAEKEETPVEE
ncbi:MAG: trigger factor [Ruminococcaceae bacterium]|nr:trigger factor [Oscillospiraceae bacterium]